MRKAGVQVVLGIKSEGSERGAEGGGLEAMEGGAGGGEPPVGGVRPETALGTALVKVPPRARTLARARVVCESGHKAAAGLPGGCARCA